MAGRIARSLSTNRVLAASGDHLPARGSLQRTSTVSSMDGIEIDCKVKIN